MASSHRALPQAYLTAQKTPELTALFSDLAHQLPFATILYLQALLSLLVRVVMIDFLMFLVISCGFSVVQACLL